MKVLLKMTLGLTAAGMLIFGAYGAYRLQAERSELVAAVQREVHLLGRSLRATAEYALRDRQVEDIREVLQALELLDEAFDVVLFTQDGQALVATHEPPLSPERVAASAREAILAGGPVLAFEPPGVLKLMTLAVPLLDAQGQLLGSLVLLRPLDDLQRDLRATRRTIALTVLAFVLASSVLGLVLGTAMIGRPLESAVAAMRRVRTGDLKSSVPVRSRDEIGELASEFNAMVAELRQARERLEAEVESRRRLQRSLQEADKLITIGQLSAGLAHEIGSPLQVLRGRAQALVAHADDADETRRVAAILVAQSDRITRIVERLLQLARRRPAQMAPVDAAATVRAVLDLLEYEARRRGVALTMEAEPGLPPLRADADQLQQVVLNLVTNAFHATTSGGRVHLRLERSVEPVSGQATLSLTVTDSGCGIRAADREHVFDPFFTTRVAEGGTGLGLSVVRAIVTGHGGRVSVDEAAGGGCRFTVELPFDPVGSLSLSMGDA